MRRFRGDPVTSPQEAIDILQGLLDQAGFSARMPRLEPLWTAFQQFLDVPVDCADSDALCQWGSYTSAPEAFEFALTRQFSFAVEDKLTGMQQLHCILSFPAAIGGGVDSGCSWASEFVGGKEFCRDLETLEAFHVVATAGEARSFTITLENIDP
jgi:hypothetical protein